MTRKELDEAMDKEVVFKFFERYGYVFDPSIIKNFAVTLHRAYKTPFYMDSRLNKQLPDLRVDSKIIGVKAAKDRIE